MVAEVLKKKSTPSSEDELKSLSSEVKKVIKMIMDDLSINQDSTLSSCLELPTTPTIEEPIELYPENGIVDLHWDPKYCAKQIALTDGNMHCFLAESGYCFRTVIADTGIMEGIAYWEIHADSRTENELKIGITSKRTINFNTVTILCMK